VGFVFLRSLRSRCWQQRLVHDLGERVKELTALHATARLLHDPQPPLELLRQIVEVLLPAWRFPKIAAGRIVAAGLDVRTEGFRPTPWLQRAIFTTPDGESGVIEVVYLEERPAAAESPFLAEERNLIASFAGLLRAYFERLHAEEDRINLARAEAARAEAQQANHAKDQFLATLSHERRSPLNVMLGWTRMLRSDDPGSERRSRGLEILERSARGQANLIEDLLDVSRIPAGAVAACLRPFSTGGWFDDPEARRSWPRVGNRETSRGTARRAD
jgi:signal transduction histidine kinase